MLKLYALLFLIFSESFLFSDDSFYSSSGDNLFPLNNSEISLTYEKLAFKNKNGLEISAYIEFTNNVEEKELLIGFETPPYHAEYDGKEGLEGSNASGIKDFKVVVNNEIVDYNVNITDKTNIVVYTFNAKFKKGFNKILHTYTIFGGGRWDYTLYSYRLSTGSRWANKKIDKIDINVDMGDGSAFSLPVYLESDKNEINWKIAGKGTGGKVLDENIINVHEYNENGLEGVNYYYIEKGIVNTTILNLNAKYDFKIISFKDTNYFNTNLSRLITFTKLYKEALNLYKLKNDKEAVKKYERAIPFQFRVPAKFYYDYGNSLSNLKERLEDSIEAYKKAIDLGFNKSLSYYNLACSYSKLGQINDAYSTLQIAIWDGYYNYQRIEKDSDLKNLRSDNAWSEWWGSRKIFINQQLKIIN